MDSHLFWLARHHDLTTLVATFGSKVDDPVGAANHIEVVLDYEHRIALVHQPLNHIHQLVHVVETQTSGGLIDQIEGLAGGALGKFGGELHPLRLTTGERGGRLAQLHVAEAHIHQGAQAIRRLGYGREHLTGLLHRHLQHVGDGEALVFHLQRLAVVAGTFADVALHVDIGQEVHLDHVHSLPAAGLAAAPLHVETELAHLVAPGLGLHRGSEHLADGVERTGVGGRVGAGGAADRALIDHDHLVDRRYALQLLNP